MYTSARHTAEPNGRNKMTTLNITKTFADLTSAIEAANTNCIADEISVTESMGVKEFHLTEANDIVYVVSFDGQKILNQVTLHSCVSNGSLAVGSFDDNGNFISTGKQTVNKSDKANRKSLCSIGLILVSPSLIEKLAA
jgi:hypothetical protein